MTRVDFHILPPGGKVERERWACRLVAKAWQQGHRVYVQTGSPAETQRMDELLWTFRDISFLPHGVAGEPGAGEVSVIIGHDEAPPEEHEVLVNLGHPVPLFFSRFERVLEIVAADDEAKAMARERFRFYKERGYPLESHNIDTRRD